MGNPVTLGLWLVGLHCCFEPNLMKLFCMVRVNGYSYIIICVYCYQFGHTLQQLLTTVEYSEVSGQSNIELDSQLVPAALMGMWLMRPDTLKSVSCHYNTNESLPDSQINSLIAGIISSFKLPQCIIPSMIICVWYGLHTHQQVKSWNSTVRLCLELVLHLLGHAIAHTIWYWTDFNVTCNSVCASSIVMPSASAFTYFITSIEHRLYYC